MLGIEIFWLVSPDHVYVKDISRMIKGAIYSLEYKTDDSVGALLLNLRFLLSDFIFCY
jgi:hypothetical protein